MRLPLRPGYRPRSVLRLLLLCTALVVLFGGCSMLNWFSGDGKKAAQEAETAEQGAAELTAEEKALQEEEKAQSLIKLGILETAFQKAPPGSTSQYLARLADEFGWEEQVGQNPLLKEAIESGAFDERVEPFLLGLFYHNGFSVLSHVGESHQFARDTVVRGAVDTSRLLVTTRKPIRIIFLKPVQNVQIVYYQDGEEPQVFTLNEAAVVSVRRSLLEQYLR